MTALVCARSESIPHPTSLEYSVLDEKSNLYAEAIFSVLGGVGC